MSFTLKEKEQIRYHLGYMNTGTAASVQLGIPKPQQTLFLVDQAMNLVLPDAEERVRRILGTLDKIECKLEEAQEYLVAKQLDGLQIREDHADQLEKEYYRWACRLADLLGVPLYPYSDRFRRVMGRGAGSIPVTNG